MISYKKRKTDKWPQLMTRAQMIEVWEKIQMHPDEELPQQPIESDENIASTTLLALVGPPSRQRDWSNLIPGVTPEVFLLPRVWRPSLQLFLCVVCPVIVR
jgi:hypothetical protein